MEQSMIQGMLKGLRGCAAELVLFEQSQCVSYTQEVESHHRANCIKEQTVAAKSGGGGIGQPEKREFYRKNQRDG